MPNSEAYNNSFIGDGFQVPELKGESEASKEEQADSSSENKVGNGALFVIGLHGSGDVNHIQNKNKNSLCEIAKKQRHVESSGAVEGCVAPVSSKGSDGRP